MSFDLVSALKTLAPTLATMLGGPLAGTAVTALEGAFGLQSGAGEKGITDVLQNGTMTTEQMANVRAADQKHAEIIAQQGIDIQKLNLDHTAAMEKIAADDRDSARKRESTVQDHTSRNLAYLIVAGAGAVIWATLMGYAKADSVMAGTIIGYVISEAKQVLTYYFGSSASSDKKTEMIANMTPIIPPNDKQ